MVEYRVVLAMKFPPISLTYLSVFHYDLVKSLRILRENKPWVVGNDPIGHKILSWAKAKCAPAFKAG